MRGLKQVGIMLAVLLCVGVAFAAMNYVRADGSVSYTNAAADISSGDVVAVGLRYGVALGDIASNGTGIVKMDGVWDFVLATNETITVGESLWWNTSTEQVGDTLITNQYIGAAMEAKTTVGLTTFVQVWLNAPVQTGL